MQPVTKCLQKEKQVSTLLITQEQLRKSAGKPQCKDGIESASVSADARSSFQNYVCPPNTASTKMEPVLLMKLKLCLISLCEMEESNMVTYRSHCTNWYFILFQCQ